MNELVIKLKKPIKVANNETYIDTEIITVKLPNFKQRNYYNAVTSVISKTILSVQDSFKNDSIGKKDGNDDEDNKDKKEIELPLILFSGAGESVNLERATNEYLIKVCKFDEDVAITDHSLGKIGFDDYNNIIKKVASFLFLTIST